MKNMKISKELKDGKLDKKTYRGDAAYELYAEKSEKDIMNSKWTGFNNNKFYFLKDHWDQ